MEKKEIEKIVKKQTMIHLPHIHPYTVMDFEKGLVEALHQALNIADVIASASFKNDLEKAIEMGESVGFNEDGGYDYFSQSDAFDAVMAVLKKHLL
jgi:hypothetical protein